MEARTERAVTAPKSWPRTCLETHTRLLAKVACATSVPSILKIRHARPMANSDRVFISYSHDTEAHKQWVRGLAKFLMDSGVDVVLDQWDVDFGDDLAAFMEKSITQTYRVLVIATDAYIAKANAGSGGVGYEKTIATADILYDHTRRRRFIPVVRDVAGDPKLPTFLGAALYVDMSGAKDTDDTRKELLRRLSGTPIQKPPLGAATFIPSEVPREDAAAKAEPPELGGREISVLFSDRFSLAFPGVRGITWFDHPVKITERLAILFASPLVFRVHRGETHLTWWWRGPKNLQVTHFEHVEGTHYVMDVKELNIVRIAAVNAGEYYQKFVYIQTAADPPTGLYDTNDNYVAERVAMFGYANEEYGLVDGTLPVKRAEYDDGAAVINDKPVDITGRVELRARFITPYNFIIAPNTSPINNQRFDEPLRRYLNRMLHGEDLLGSDVVPAVLALPKRS